MGEPLGAAGARDIADNRPYDKCDDISGIIAEVWRLWQSPSVVDVWLPGDFWMKVNQAAKAEDDNGCWPWPGGTDRNGYARFGSGANYGTAYVHLLLWRHEHGEAPDGYEVDHVCRVRHCVNPAHRECITLAENRARRVYEYKSHCPKGHPYSGDNLYINPKSGSRSCRECMREANRRLRAKRSTAA